MKNFNENWDGRLPRKNTNDINTLSEASQQVIGKYRFTPFTEGSIKGWTISIQGTGQVGYIEEPAKKNSKTTFSPYKVYRTKGASSPWELKMSALPGTETRIISEKEIRFAPRQLLKAIAMWMDKYGKVMTESERVTEEEVERIAEVMSPQEKAKQDAIDARIRKVNTDNAVDQIKEILRSYTHDKKQREMILAAIKNIKEEAAAGAQSLDEVQFITPKVPLTGGSNSNSKEKSDYKLYVELKDVVKDAIGILSEAELKIRNPSKNSNLSVLGTIHQANQRLKHAINFGLR